MKYVIKLNNNFIGYIKDGPFQATLLNMISLIIATKMFNEPKNFWNPFCEEIYFPVSLEIILMLMKCDVIP